MMPVLKELTYETHGVKAIVCGGRGYGDCPMIYNALDYYHSINPFSLIIQGGAAGADYLAKQWAISRGVKHLEIRAEWKRYGRMAGAVRNQKMINDTNPCVVIAFPGGSGTADMVKRAKLCGIDVIKGIEWDAIES
jgi:hypothetical protein